MSVWLPDWLSNFLKSKFWKLFLINFKMISILIDIILHEQYVFYFSHKFLLFARSYQSHITSCLSLMSHHQVNNKCYRVKGRHWRWLIYALRNFLLHNMLRVFRSNNHCSWKFHRFHRKTPLLESLFFLKWNYIKTFVLHE